MQCSKNIVYFEAWLLHNHWEEYLCDNMAWTDLVLISSWNRQGQRTFWCECPRADWRDSLPRAAGSIFGHVDFPCCLQLSCTDDKMPRVNKKIVGTTRTQWFVRGKWGKAGQGISQPSMFHQESHVKYFKQLSFLGDAAPRTQLLLWRNTAVPKGHHVDPKQYPLALKLRTVDSLVDSGKNDCSERQFGCCALEVPIKGKQWECAQLEKSSKVPIHI